MTRPFIHLHLHSEYSLVDGTIRIGDLVKRAAKAGMPAVALTDQNNLFALVKFYRKAEEAGIKPIAGADLWVHNPQDPDQPSRILTLCADQQGYLSLSRLISRAYREGQYLGPPQVRAEWLDEHNAGLICLLGAHSEPGRCLVLGHDDTALDSLGHWQRRFGDRLYLEVMRTGRADEEHFLAGALDIAARAGLPVVASNDVRFLDRDDYEAHEARVCIHQGRALNDPKRPRDYSAEQYLKTSEEMQALFADLPGVLDNASELAQRCNLELRLGTYYLPAFPVPVEHTLDSFIRTRSREGLAERLAKHPPAPKTTADDYAARLELELDVIVQMGFPGYFLIVADFIVWAKDHGIPVGPGRGSGAGSLVAYALGITDLDPIRYDLLFERFLNPERVSMPDFDIDFCMDRRDEVIAYVGEKYGRERVCQIITYGSMAAKAVLRDTGRVLGMSYGHVDRIAKLIPARPIDISLEDALGRSEKAAKESERVSADLVTAYEQEEEVRNLVDLALKLEDLARNAGKHAGGVVIAPSDLTDFCPLYCEAGSDSVVTQFDKDDVESIGLVKFDFLGLRTLTIIDWAVKAINGRRQRKGEPDLDITTLPLEDGPTFGLLRRCETTAVFQLESRGMKELIRKLQPDNFDEIVALVALFRPGPLQSGMVDDFIDRKHGRSPVTYPHPLLEPILKSTYGVIVYQEQVMQIAQVLAGYTLGGADLLRRAMGKKKPEEMAKQREIFESGAASHSIDAQVATSIFDLMEKFAEYGFNKSHSAAYALVSYQTAWLKAHYPAEFMAATLSSDMDNTDKVVNFLDECRAMRMTVHPPDVNASDYMFTAQDDGTIRYGLGAIKGLGQGVAEAIVAARKSAQGRFESLIDFCQRVSAAGLNRRVFDAMICAGALDSLGINRATLAAQLPEALKAAEQRARNLAIGQGDIFGSSVSAPIKLPSVDEWPLEQRLQGERETLGLYLSGHPTDAYRDWLVRVVTCAIGEAERHYRPSGGGNGERRGRAPEVPVVLAGMLTSFRKRGENMGFIQLEDASGRIEVALYRDTFAECQAKLIRDRILVVEGGLTIDDYAGGFQLKAKAVLDLDEACARFVRLVKLSANGVDAGFAARLERTLAPYRGGETPLRLSLKRSGACVELELGESWRLRAGRDLIAALRALSGVDSADLVFARG